jgi:hypothetical protein
MEIKLTASGKSEKGKYWGIGKGILYLSTQSPINKVKTFTATGNKTENDLEVYQDSKDIEVFTAEIEEL